MKHFCTFLIIDLYDTDKLKSERTNYSLIFIFCCFFFGYLIYAESFSPNRYNSCFKYMQPSSNKKQYSHCPERKLSFSFEKDLDRITSDIEKKQHSEVSSPKVNPNYLFAHQTDNLGASSWNSISLQPFEAIPDVGQGARRSFGEEQINKMVSKCSNCSLGQQRIESLTQKQAKMIEQTQNMRISLENEEEESESSSMLSCSNSGELISQKIRKGKIQKIRKARILMKQLKRYVKAEIFEIIGSFIFRSQGFQLAIKKGPVTIECDQVGNIEKMIIDNGEDVFQICIKKCQNEKEKYKLEYWNGQSYIEVSFIAQLQSF